jgi:transposase InsO family protein
VVIPPGFKLDLGDANRFDFKGELIEKINQTINYYNKSRIHTALKTSPSKYYEQYNNEKSILLKKVKNEDHAKITEFFTKKGLL